MPHSMDVAPRDLLSRAQATLRPRCCHMEKRLRMRYLQKKGKLLLQRFGLGYALID